MVAAITSNDRPSVAIAESIDANSTSLPRLSTFALASLEVLFDEVVFSVVAGVFGVADLEQPAIKKIMEKMAKASLTFLKNIPPR
ncbi:hypothetical protein D3C73_1055840 [compost metagenome]